MLPTTTITDEKKHQEALSKAKEMEAVRDAETATLGQTFIRGADKVNAFSKLSRYETTIERSLYKALHELQRLRAVRGAEATFLRPWPWTSTYPGSQGKKASKEKWLCFAKIDRDACGLEIPLAHHPREEPRPLLRENNGLLVAKLGRLSGAGLLGYELLLRVC